jgi:protein-S-isoprenylcysteine O-methyltransferase Ste14
MFLAFFFSAMAFISLIFDWNANKTRNHRYKNPPGKTGKNINKSNCHLKVKT